MDKVIDPETKCGGFGPTEPATEDFQKICDKVKPDAEEISHKKYDEFKVTLYRRQIVAGENFLIKVHVGKDDYIHLSVFQALPCYEGQLTLKGVKEHQTKDSPIEPF